MKEKKHISLIIIMLSLTLFCCYHIYYYFLDENSNDLKREYYTNNLVKEDRELVKKIDNKIKEEYLGIIKIPRINLEEGFYNINSEKNNINTAVTILRYLLCLAIILVMPPTIHKIPVKNELMNKK